MKKNILLVIILILSLAACTDTLTFTVTTVPRSASPLPTATVKVSDTASPSASAELLTSVSATASPTPEPKAVYQGPTIIATSSGEIRGGYADGQWLTGSEAASYCNGKMTFIKYNLVDSKGKVNSSGVTHEKGEHASETSDGESSYNLKTPKVKGVDIDDYGLNPLCYSYLYYGGKLPDIKAVNATSAMKRAVQKLLDKKPGKGKAKAKVRFAVSADIDGDGKKETVVNADNVIYDGDSDDGDSDDGDSDDGDSDDGGPGYGKPQYCLSCIIENDGTVKVIQDYYFVPTEEEFDEAVFFYVQNVIDLDGDNISELIVDSMYGEESGTTVYKYDGSSVEKILDYYVNHDIT